MVEKREMNTNAGFEIPENKKKKKHTKCPSKKCTSDENACMRWCNCTMKCQSWSVFSLITAWRDILKGKHLSLLQEKNLDYIQFPQ